LPQGWGRCEGHPLRPRGPSPARSGSHPLPQAGEGINVAPDCRALLPVWCQRQPAGAGSNSPLSARNERGGAGGGAPCRAPVRCHSSSLDPSATGSIRLLSSRGTGAGLPRPSSTDPTVDSSALQPPVRPHPPARPGLRMTDSPLHPFTPSPVHPFTRSPPHPFTLSPFHPFTPSPFHPFTLSPFHPFTLTPPPPAARRGRRPRTSTPPPPRRLP
jgi:hypothetical protein